MKQSEIYDATYTTRRFGRANIVRPAITVKRAREIFEAAKPKVSASRVAHLNRGITQADAFDILSKAVDLEMSDDAVLHSLTSRNIVREFGRYLK